MDDYNSNLLNDSKSEWSVCLMNILSGHIIDGFRSIFSEAMDVCEKNDEAEKYLMTFQNYLSMIPKWNQNMVDTEVERIKESSQCKYLEDLITCVHILQLKILSCVRTGNQNKKIDIDVPCFTIFLHNVYINIARKLYSNIYLFQIDASPLQQQKHNREFEVIVQSCIMNTIRDNVPVEQLLKQYIDETQEVDVEKLEKIVEDKQIVSNPEESDNNENKSENDITTTGETSNIVNQENDMDTPPPPSNDDDAVANEMIGVIRQTPTAETMSHIKVKEMPNKSISFHGHTSQQLAETESSHKLTFGDNVPLIVDRDFDNLPDTANEIEEINLDIDNIEDENHTDNSEPPIDLGIEEFAI